jgi:hypothetical protein
MTVFNLHFNEEFLKLEKITKVKDSFSCNTKWFLWFGLIL